jgi:hypothetical protein
MGVTGVAATGAVAREAAAVAAATGVVAREVAAVEAEVAARDYEHSNPRNHKCAYNHCHCGTHTNRYRVHRRR